MTATADVIVLKIEPEEEPSAIVCAIPCEDQPLHQFMQDEDPHVTLAYLGPASELSWFMSTAADDVQEAAASTGPFRAKVSGYGRLGDNGAAVLFLESEELSALHDEVLAQPCIGQIQEIHDSYPEWIPHITLGYGEEYPEEKLVAAGEAVPWVVFDKVGLWAGESQLTFLLDQGLTQLYQDVDQGKMVDMNENSYGIDPTVPITSKTITSKIQVGGPVWAWDGTASGFKEIGHALHVFTEQMNQMFGVTAAAKPGSYDPSLHPRGADGRFIPTTGLIKWLKNGHWKYGKVSGINKGDHGNTEITVSPSDLGGKLSGEPATVLRPSQVYEAPQKKAHLPIGVKGGENPTPESPVKKVGGQGGGNAGGMYEIPKAGQKGKQPSVPQASPGSQHAGEYAGMDKAALEKKAAEEATYWGDLDTKMSYDPDLAIAYAFAGNPQGKAKEKFVADLLKGTKYGTGANVSLAALAQAEDIKKKLAITQKAIPLSQKNLAEAKSPEGKKLLQKNLNAHLTNEQNQLAALDKALQTLVDFGGDPVSLGVVDAGDGDDGSPEKYYVKQAGSKEKGRNEELANVLYADAGVYVPEVDYNPADNNIYSKIINGEQDMATQVNNPEWLDKVRRNFVVDAWLANRDVFGLNYDNMITDPNGEPIRIDNGGALLYRAMGAKKTDFDGKVGELDVFRTGKKAKIFGPGMTQEQELDGAQRVLAISPGQIEDRVAESGLPKSLADTLKARRKYIADYYGLPLPESVKPMDSDQVATTAPVFDPGDLVSANGKDRNWLPAKLGQAQFVLAPGDRVHFPDGTEEEYGKDESGHYLSVVGKQNQLLGWLQKHGPDADVQTKAAIQSVAKRPNHGETLAVGNLTAVAWQRGDTITAPDGTVYDVRGANEYSGGVLLQQRMADGSKTTPFLLDTLESNPAHADYTVTRWDPPVEPPVVPEDQVQAEPVATDVPEIKLPQQPTGMAETAKTEIKADLEEPLPDPAAPHISPTEPEQQELETINAEPEAVDTATPTPPPAEPAPVVEPPAAPAPKAAPGSGMALGDGTEAKPGAKVFAAADGKTYTFVKSKGPYAKVTSEEGTEHSILASKLSQPGVTPTVELETPKSANGVVPSTGQYAVAKDGWEGEITMISPDGKFVFITNADGKRKRKSVGTVTIKGTTEEKAPEPPKPADEPLEEWEKQLLEAVDLLPASTDVTGPEGDYKPVSQLDLKVGDQISEDGQTWLTVDAVTWGGSVWATMPDGITQKQIGDSNGSFVKGDLPDPNVIQTSSVSTAGMIDPHNDFGQLAPYTSWEHAPGVTLTTVGYPGYGDNPAVVVMINNDPAKLAVVYQKSLHHDQVHATVVKPGPEGEPDSDTVSDMYQAALEHTPVKGNAAISHMAIKQGIDLNAENQYLTFDTATETFWNNPPGQLAQKWNKDSKAWETPDEPVLAESFQAVDPVHVPEGAGVFGLEKHPAQIEDLPLSIQAMLNSGAMDTVVWFKAKPDLPGGYWYVFDSKNPDSTVTQVNSDSSVTDPVVNTGKPVSKMAEKFNTGDVPAGSIAHDVTPEAPEEPPEEEAGPALTMTPTAPGEAPAQQFNGYTPKPGDVIQKVTYAGTVSPLSYYFIQNPDGSYSRIQSDGSISPANISLEDMQDTISADGDALEQVWPPAGSGVPEVVNGYTLKPGESAVMNKTGTIAFVKKADDTDGTWYKVSPITHELNEGLTFGDETVDGLVSKGWTKHGAEATPAEDVNQPEANAPEANAPEAEASAPEKPPEVFGGYTAQEGDQIVMTAPVGTQAEPTYMVKKPGETEWTLVNPAVPGTVIQFDDETVNWAMNTVVGSKQVYGDPFEPDKPTTPVTDIIGLSVTGKPKFADLVKADGGELNNSQELTWSSMPPLNPGDTLYASTGTFTSVLYVESNTGEVWEYTAYGVPFVSSIPKAGVTKVNIVPSDQPPSSKSNVPALPGGYKLKPGEKVVHVDYNDPWGSDLSEYYLVSPVTNDAYLLSDTGVSGIPTDLDFHKTINPQASYTEYTAAGQVGEIKGPVPAPAATTNEDFTPDGVPKKFQPGKGQAVLTFTDDDQPLAFAKVGPDEHQLISPATGNLSPNVVSMDDIKYAYGADQVDEATWVYPNGFYNDAGVSVGFPSAAPAAPTPAPVSTTAKPDWVPDIPDHLTFPGQKFAKDKDGDIWVENENGNYNSVEGVLAADDKEDLPYGSSWDWISTAYSPIEVFDPAAAAPKPGTPATPTGGKPGWVPDVASTWTFPGQQFVKDKNDTVWIEMPTGGYIESNYLGIDVSEADWDTQEGQSIDYLEHTWGPTEIYTPPPPQAAPAAPPPAASTPTYPGSVLPTELEKASWGGALTKDGYVPSVGMYVTGKAAPGGKPLRGKIVSFSADKTKATVITDDGKKTQRLITALGVDKGKNYQKYAAPAMVAVDVPADMPIAADPPGLAIQKTLADGKWRPILSGSGGTVGGEMVVMSNTTPSGKKVARVHFTLTHDQQKLLVAKLTQGPAAPAEKGDWVTSTKQSQDVSAGDQIPMRKSSTANPDGSDRWKVDPSVTPPTHVVVSVTDGPGGVKNVTMKPVGGGPEIVSHFHPGKQLTTYTWDPDKPKPAVPMTSATFNLSSEAQAQGWNKVTDGAVSAISGGPGGTLKTEPGQTVTAPAIGWAKSSVGLRKVSSNGVVIEVMAVNKKENDSARGYTVVTLPEGADETHLGAALADLGIPYEPVNQDNAKIAARPLLKQLLSSNVAGTNHANNDKPFDPMDMKGWTDAKIFATAATTFGIPDIGWHDVLLGSDESTGKVSYFWSERVRNQIESKKQMNVLVRAAETVTADTIISQVMYGGSNGLIQKTGGMFGGSGMSAPADTQRNAAHGSYVSGITTSKLPSKNTLFSMKTANMMIYTQPMSLFARIGDYRVGEHHGDKFGGGTGPGANNPQLAMSQAGSQDLWIGGGIPGETVAFVAVTPGYESQRKAAIQKLKGQGITHMYGRPIEEIIIPMSQATSMSPNAMPPAYLPVNLRPITDLPTGYVGGTVAAA